MIFLDNNNKTGLLCCPRPSSNQIYFKFPPEWLRNNFSSWFSHSSLEPPKSHQEEIRARKLLAHVLPCIFHRRLPGSLQQLTNSISSKGKQQWKKVKSKKTILQELVWIHLEVNETEREHSSRWEGSNERELRPKKHFKCRKKPSKIIFGCVRHKAALSREATKGRQEEEANHNNNTRCWRMLSGFLVFFRKKGWRRRRKEREREMETTLSHQLIRFHYEFSFRRHRFFGVVWCKGAREDFKARGRFLCKKYLIFRFSTCFSLTSKCKHKTLWKIFRI